jgi:hypothetical protein
MTGTSFFYLHASVTLQPAMHGAIMLLLFATPLFAGFANAIMPHHMFTTGAVLLPFFSLVFFFIAIPTGIKFFQLGRHHTTRRPGRAARRGGPVPGSFSRGGGLSRRKPAAPRGRAAPAARCSCCPAHLICGTFPGGSMAASCAVAGQAASRRVTCTRHRSGLREANLTNFD